MKYWSLLAIAVVLLATAIAFVSVPVYGECRSGGHSVLYCLMVAGR